jgi:hypothetical protein
MLEKIAGVCLVEKLHDIQLHEADFNCCNQFIFRKQAMKLSRKAGTYQRSYSAKKAARLRMQNLIKLLWLISPDKQGNL